MPHISNAFTNMLLALKVMQIPQPTVFVCLFAWVQSKSIQFPMPNQMRHTKMKENNREKATTLKYCLEDVQCECMCAVKKKNLVKHFQNK